MAAGRSDALATFNRPLDDTKLVFKRLFDRFGGLLDREHWSINLTLELGFPPSITDLASCLNRAWQALQYQHQMLRATVLPPSSSSTEARPIASVSPYDPAALHAEAETRTRLSLHPSIRPEAGTYTG
ncbi:hypothetical protein GGR52DRAFT_171899 [Hypoxylon sp. FL1284]|nr:hypothetical protein GGR52DRAFT_171899 [Hypoxylon sp. FL1284]